jgi:hypothetical protein
MKRISCIFEWTIVTDMCYILNGGVVRRELVLKRYSQQECGGYVSCRDGKNYIVDYTNLIWDTWQDPMIHVHVV